MHSKISCSDSGESERGVKVIALMMMMMIRVRPILSRCPKPDTIDRSYTDTNTGLYKYFVLKMRFCAGYRCVQVIYVCGVDA